jgi:hypothetical protein
MQTSPIGYGQLLEEIIISGIVLCSAARMTERWRCRDKRRDLGNPKCEGYGYFCRISRDLWYVLPVEPQD